MRGLKLIYGLMLVGGVAHPQNISDSPTPGMPTSGGYKPPALTLDALITESSPLGRAMMTFANSGDTDAFRKFVQVEANSGDVGAQLLLAEQYIPEACTFEPNRDSPHCGKDGNEAPRVIFRQNPLGLPASYEEAARWLERASSNGSGEASEILAQLITRMYANGHNTTYTKADSTHLHSLARIHGFDVEALSVICYQHLPGPKTLEFIKDTGPAIPGFDPIAPFTDEQQNFIRTTYGTGLLRYEGGAGGGDSVLLSRPEGDVVDVRVILDHAPKTEVHLPLPAHHNVVYVQQRDDTFVAMPSEGNSLPRFISIMPQREDYKQVSIFTQQMSGGFSGGSCGRF